MSASKRISEAEEGYIENTEKLSVFVCAIFNVIGSNSKLRRVPGKE